MEADAFLARDVELFCRQLEGLVALRGRATVDAWQAQARSGRIAEVFLALMHSHYDPGYLKSMRNNFSGFARARRVPISDGWLDTLRGVAAALLHGTRSAASSSDLR